MALVEMVMPKMGESVMEGTILKWLKAIGDTIEQDEPVLEVATDKVDTEIPAIQGGILKEILAQEGDVVQIGKVIAIIATDADDTSDAPSAVSQSQERPNKDKEEESPVLVDALETIEQSLEQAHSFVSNASDRLSVPAEGRFYSPLVMNIAKTEGISMQELSYIPGSGLEDRVTKKDILNYLTHRNQDAASTPTPQPQQEAKKETAPKQAITASTPISTPQATTSNGSINGNVEIIEMDRMRRMIADRMVDSKRISPHVTTFIEVDVTNIVLWRNKIKENFKKKEGENLTFTPIFIEAIVKALKDFPMVNISVEGDKIIRKKDINIGMATALPSGNLIVPVIHNADHLSLVGLSKKINELANRARQNKLKPDELSGGTYTVSNIGSFGNEMGTPIIMQPQVAIMAIGAIKKKPAVIETEAGDMIGIRHLMFISHSYDHRVVDGALGGMFGRRVADYLEAFDINRSI
jgi:2-oxoglutarate dehydrogenase E2 component (dihydrolipoamide succinyltransferase)